MKILAFILVVIFSHGLSAQNLVPYRLNEQWGFADETGKIIIQPKYVKADFFRSDGYALVSSDSLVLLVDKSGKEILPGIYTAIAEFSNGLAAVCRGGKYNWIQGEIIGGQWGFINANFEEVIPCKYSRAESFVGDYAIVQSDDNWGAWGLIDKSGKTILAFKYESYSFDMRPFPGLIWGPTERTLQQDMTGRGEIWQTIDLKGRPLGVKYKSMHGRRTFYEKDNQREDLYSVQYPQKTGPIKLKDPQGSVITLIRSKTSFEYLGSNLFSISLPAKEPPDDGNPDAKKYALINQKGDILVDFGQYDYYSTCSDNRISVLKNGVHGYIDCNTGKEIVAPKYDYTENFKNGYAHVYYNYSSHEHKADGFINSEGKEFFYDDPVVNVVFHNGVQILDEHNILLNPPWISPENILTVSGRMVKITNADGVLLALGKIEGTIREFTDWEEYCCRLYPNSTLFNTVDTTTTRIRKLEIMASDDAIIQSASFSDSLFVISKDQKAGLMGQDGNMILPVQFESILPTQSSNKLKDEAGFIVNLENSQTAVYSVEGKEIIGPSDAIQEYTLSNGKSVFVVTRGDLMGSVDKNGKTLIPFDYSRIEPLDEGSRYQTIGNYKDLTGVAKNFSEIVIPVVNSEVSMERWRNQVFFRVFNKKYTLILDSLGRILVPKEYADGDLSPAELDIHDDHAPMYFLLYRKKKWGAYRPDKGLFIPFSKYSLDLYAANEKVYFIYSEKSQDQYGILDGDGKVILPPIYSSIDFLGSPDIIAVALDKDSIYYNFTVDHKLIKIEQ